jgi:hypothetical protein
LDKGADASAKTNDGSCPLHYFVRMDPKNVTEFHKVLERMAVGDSPAQRARTVNTQNRHGESPLHHAAIKGREHVRAHCLHVLPLTCHGLPWLLVVLIHLLLCCVLSITTGRAVSSPLGRRHQRTRSCSYVEFDWVHRWCSDGSRLTR